jgi:serine/threonine protein kinase
MAINMNNTEKVAIKIMKTSAKSMGTPSGHAANLLDAFINEVTILSGLDHKHIVHVKDF